MCRFLLIGALVIVLVNCQQKVDETAAIVEVDQKDSLIEIPKAENYATQVIIQCQPSAQKNLDSIIEVLQSVKPGGVQFKNWNIQNIQDLALRIDTLPFEKPLFFIDYFQTLEVEPYPIWGANQAFQDSIFWHGFLAAGINAVQLPSDITAQNSNKLFLNNLQNSVDILPTYVIDINTLKFEDYKKIGVNLQQANGALWLQGIENDSLPYQQIRKALNWEGLIISQSSAKHQNHLNAGADMVVVGNYNQLDIAKYRQNRKTVFSFNKITELIQKQNNSNYYQYSASSFLKAIQLHFVAKSTVLFKNTSKVIPLKKYSDLSIHHYLALEPSTKKYLVHIPKNAVDSLLVQLKSNKNNKNTVFVFSNPIQYHHLKNLPNLVFSHANTHDDYRVLNEQISGKLSINGNLIVNNKVYKGKKTKGQGLVNLPVEFAFIDGKKLALISSLVASAINGKAFPGCQILGIKNNVVVYQKSFGHTTYQANLAVNQQHIYDLASLTKVFSTTLVGMKLWEDGYFKLDEPIGKYLPDSLGKYLPNGSTIRNITFQELFIHQSGLPAGFPVIGYMRKAADLENRYYNGFCDYPYENYQTEVASDLYLENSFQDSMWLTLNSLWLEPTKAYKYSDVNMNTLYFIFKRIIEEKKLVRYGAKDNAFEKYLYEYFYTPLNMRTTRYLPLKQFDKNRIVPTENDRYWRKQLLQGHVHDPNAALYGGVAGNAGLFSNASDIGKLLTMWQNNGIFEGRRYLSTETIQKFIKTQPNTHRGLGFNKRTFTNATYAMAASADQSSYGHTGFTGTCFWLDPVNKISYVFLSNRVHPKVTNKIYEFNIRANVHQVFYDAMLK